MSSLRQAAEGAITRGLSPAIWQQYGFIGGGNINDPSYRPFFFDDFATLGVMASTVSQGGYITIQDTGVTIGQSGDCDNSEGEFGVMKVYHDGTAHDEGNIELGSGVGGLLRIDTTTGEKAVVAMEARVKVTLVTVGSCCFALGIAEPSISAADMIVDTTGALVVKDFVGFQTLLTSNSEIDTIYCKAGGAVVQVKDNAATMVADTWIKLGFVYDPNGAANHKLRFFADGVELGDSVTDAVIVAGTAFPTDEEMTLCLGTKILTASATSFYMDWWACGAYSVE